MNHALQIGERDASDSAVDEQGEQLGWVGRNLRAAVWTEIRNQRQQRRAVQTTTSEALGQWPESIEV